MILREAGDVLNDIIHSEILKHSNHDLKLNLHKFNIEVQINNIDYGCLSSQLLALQNIR